MFTNPIYILVVDKRRSNKSEPCVWFAPRCSGYLQNCKSKGKVTVVFLKYVTYSYSSDARHRLLFLLVLSFYLWHTKVLL